MFVIVLHNFTNKRFSQVVSWAITSLVFFYFFTYCQMYSYMAVETHLNAHWVPLAGAVHTFFSTL